MIDDLEMFLFWCLLALVGGCILGVAAGRLMVKGQQR